PSSDYYELNSKFQFCIKNEAIYNKEGKLKEANEISLSDLTIDILNKDNSESLEKYLKIFKLKGRYQVHNSEIKTLIQKRILYPDEHIKEMALKIGQEPNLLKKTIFGEELFNEDSNIPLHKM